MGKSKDVKKDTKKKPAKSAKEKKDAKKLKKAGKDSMQSGCTSNLKTVFQ